MRFNGKDIGILSRLWMNDYEGKIMLKEKSESLFRKITNWEAHWARLKGNILVILKSDQKESTDVYGIVIMEHFEIEIIQEKEEFFTFKIVFQADDAPIEIASFSLPERDEWIEKLHNSSLLSTREHIENVRNWIYSKTGHDPLDMPFNTDEDSTCGEDDVQDAAGMELRFSCTNLPPIKKGSSKYPNYCIFVSLLLPENELVRVGHTENESEGNPTFMKTVFIKSSFISTASKVRLKLVDVVDVNVQRMHTIASVTVEMSVLKQMSAHEFRLSPADGHHFSVLYVRVCLRQPLYNLRLADSSRLMAMKTFCDNIIPKLFAFPIQNSESFIEVVELLGESLLNSVIPIEYLKQVIQKERLLYDSLNSCNVPTEFAALKTLRLKLAKNCLMNYEMALKNTCDHPGVTFRPSVRRRETEVEFMPLNLHVHRTCVLSSDDQSDSIHDVTTVGCFAASSRKFKNGGLKRIKEKYDSVLNDSLVNKCFEILNKGLRLKNQLEDNLNCMVGQVSGGNEVAVAIHRPKLLRRYNKFASVTKDPMFNDVVCLKRSSDLLESLLDILRGVPSPKDGGLNTECVKLVRDVNEELIKAVDNDWKTANDLLWTRIIKRITSMNSDFDDYHYRLHIATSQALTAALTALATTVPRWSYKDWLQMSKCGILVHFEGLLSCYGDEQGMIEDMVVSIQNLKDMVLHFFPSSSSASENYKMKSMNTIRIPCSFETWNNIPEELSVTGKVVLRWHPVFVNVGINEQQTIAERRGRTQVQDTINMDAYTAMKHYFDLYCHNMGVLPRMNANEDPSDLLKVIYHELTIVHSVKPVLILKCFTELTWALNGLRVTSCKSAKDRTAMSLTLEQMNWLISRHNLCPDYLQAGLDCLRSTGLRRVNTLKNVGSRKYAFTKVQLVCYPKLYRPPPGTYGHVQT